MRDKVEVTSWDLLMFRRECSSTCNWVALRFQGVEMCTVEPTNCPRLCFTNETVQKTSHFQTSVRSAICFFGWAIGLLEVGMVKKNIHIVSFISSLIQRCCTRWGLN